MGKLKRLSCLAVFASVVSFGAVTSSLAQQADDSATANTDLGVTDSNAPIDDAVPEGHSLHGEVFNEGPRQRAYLMGGTGAIQFPVTTAHPEVQAFIEQGIGQLHGFWYFEAERTFRQAAMLDPDCAIAYWGMAMANTNSDKRAKGFIAEAAGRKENAGPREAMYIDALNDLLTSDEKEKTRARKYVSAMEEIVATFPDDVEAKGLLGNALYKYREDIGRSHEEAEAELKKVLSLQPLHPVHHYLIHLWDREKPSNALESSALCGPSSPSIAHMWHMPGHIYWGLKRYRDSAWQQEASARVDHAHMMRDRVMPDQIHNFAHNNEWLIRSLINIGRFRDAIDLAKNMIELPRHPNYNVIGKRGSAYFGRVRLLDVLSGYELWDELIGLAAGPYLAPTDSEAEQVRRLRHLGVAYARSGDGQRAEATLAELEQRLESAVVKPEKEESQEDTQQEDSPEEDNAQQNEPQEDAAVEEETSEEGPQDDRSQEDSPEKPAQQQDKSADNRPRERRRRRDNPKRNLERAIAAIQGHLAAVDGDYQASLPLLKKADEDKLAVARVQCLAGEMDDAIKAARRHVRSNESEVRPLAGYVDILWLAGKKEEAAKAFDQLRELSAEIQFGSPLFDRLAPIAKELGLPADWRVTQPPPDDIGQRPQLDSLGTFRWQPVAAPDWVLKDYQGTPYSLSQFRGRPVVVIFYLGYGCLHCAEQLQAIAPMTEKFRQAGISLIAVSTDDRKGLRMSLENYEGGMPFPLVADAGMDVFKAYRAYDGFEDMPLHGTYLVDADGLVRWQDISYEPFTDVDFVLDESRRLLSSPVARTTSELVSADDDAIHPESSLRFSQPRTRIEPVGIAGSLIIAGNDAPDDAYARFWDLARGKKARAVVLRTDSDETTRANTQRLLEHWERKESASIQVLRVDSVERARDAGLAAALASATAVWIAGNDAERVHRLISETEFLPACRTVLQQGGCIGGSAASVPLFSQVRLAGRGCDETDKNGSGLLPDSIIEVLSADEEAESRIPGALKKHPRLVGYEIGDGAALVVRGRRLRAIGEGNVNIRLAASIGKPAKEIALGASRRHADLTALRRSAVERANEESPPIAPGLPTLENGTLILVGGGEVPGDVIAQFVELAGGPDASIVIFPTAIADPIPRRNRMATTFRRAGAKKVTVLPGRKLSEVESEEYLNSLREATGICFGGGRQWRFVDAYLDTKAHALMHELLRRGGVIMGSSAGASIQADYLARGNPLGNHEIMAEGYERGLGFLKGVAVDQHFTQRRRFGDMKKLIEQYPQLLGIGIDESTAVIVQGHVAEVTGRGAVHFFDARKSSKDEQNPCESVHAGSRFDLVSRTILDHREENATHDLPPVKSVDNAVVPGWQQSVAVGRHDDR